MRAPSSALAEIAQRASATSPAAMSRRDSAEQNSKPVSRSSTQDPRFGASNGGDAPIPLYHKPRGKREGLIYRLVALLLQLRLSSASVVLSVLAILLVSLALVGRRGTDASLQFGDNLMTGSEGIEVRPTVAGVAGDAGEMTWMEVERLARGGARAQDRFGFGSLKGDGRSGGNGGSGNVDTLATSGEKGTREKGETSEVVGRSGISAVDSIDLIDFKDLVVHAAIDLPDFILLLLRPLAPSDSPKSDVAAGYTAADVAAATGKRSLEEGASNGMFRGARFGKARVSQQQLERIKEMQCSFAEVVWQALNHRKRPPPLVYDAVTVRRGERRGREVREGRGRGYDGREEKGDTVEGGEREEREGREGVYLFVRGLQTNPHLPPVLANVTCVFGADGGTGRTGGTGALGSGNEGAGSEREAEQVGLLRVPARAAAMEVVFCPLPDRAAADGGTGNSSSSGGGGGGSSGGGGGNGGSGGGRDGTGVGAAAMVANLAMRTVTVEFEGRLFPSVALFVPVDPFDQPEAPHGQQDGDEGSNGQRSSDGSQNGGSDSDGGRTGDGLSAGSAGNGSSTRVGTKQEAGVEAGEEVGGSTVGESGLNREKPHFVCVCTMIFNVGKFLREWVVYHHWMGVDRIFLYDNNSEDNTTAVVASLAADGGARLVVGTPAAQAAAAVVAEAAARGGGGGGGGGEEEGRLGRSGRLGGAAVAGGEEVGIEGAQWWVRAGFVGSTHNQSHAASPSEVDPSSRSPSSPSSISSSSSSAPHSRPSTPVVTLHPWPWIKSQQAGFSHCVLRAARQCEWVGFIDVDEFVAPKFIAHIAEKRKDLGGEVREKGVFIPHLLRRVVRASEKEIEEVVARKGVRGERGEGEVRRRRMAGGGRGEVVGGGVRERGGEEVGVVAGVADVEGARESGGVGGGVGRRLLAGGEGEGGCDGGGEGEGEGEGGGEGEGEGGGGELEISSKGANSKKGEKGKKGKKIRGSKKSKGEDRDGKQAKKNKQAKEEEEKEEEDEEGMRKGEVEKKKKQKKSKKGSGSSEATGEGQEGGSDSTAASSMESERAEDDVRPLGQISFPCVDFGPSGLSQHPQQGVSVGYTCRARKPDRHKSFVRPEAVADSLLCHIHQFELKEERYRTQVFSGRVRLANINHYKFQVWDEFKAKYRRRVATYTKDWKGAKQNSIDLIPGLGTDALEPPDWAGRFCERNDTVLRDFVKLAFAVEEDGKGGDVRNRTCLAWE
ncbi:unnamed protein product [Closterium sp. Naga37s-1]|nr:unnamed protein product [Closterium sp. Naga37s-1]